MIYTYFCDAYGGVFFSPFSGMGFMKTTKIFSSLSLFKFWRSLYCIWILYGSNETSHFTLVPPSGLKIGFSVFIHFQIERLIIEHFIFLTNLKGYQCIFFWATH